MKKPKRTSIIGIAIIVSILLYLAGVLSGLYANKILEKKTETNLEFMQSYIDVMDSSLKNIQLEQNFLSTLSDNESCKFSEISMNNLLKQLDYYWKKFPFRLEEYERGEVSEEYLLLKQQYTQLSIRTWMLTLNMHTKCNSEPVPILYFYSANCSVCVNQGEELDRLKELKKNQEKVFVFTIDSNSNESIVKLIKEYYEITSTPAIVVENSVMQGRLFKAEEILKE